MLTLYRGTTQTIFLTLREKETLETPHYLFVFRSRVPGVQVAAVLEKDEYDGRTERFTVDVSAVFGDAAQGQYLYTVYEQESSTNTNPDIAGAVLEQGIAMYWTDRAFQYEQNETTTQYIQPS